MSDKFRCVHLNYYPVGQGLFTSGKICDKDTIRFSWIYDCGTTGQENNIDKLTDLFFKDMNKKHVLDLLIVSHFDEDHYKGISNLVSKCEKIKTIVLPYLEIEERLLLFYFAFKKKYIKNEDKIKFFNFFINPNDFFSDKVEKIILIRKSGNDEQIPEENKFSENENDNDYIIKYEFEEKKENDNKNYFIKPDNKKVEILKKRTIISLKNFWEFIFYNDPSIEFYNNNDFKEKIKVEVKYYNNRINEIISKSNEKNKIEIINNIIKKLKNIYDDKIKDIKKKKRSKIKNESSLFLYTGPSQNIYKNSNLNSKQKFGSLYTGDGNLKSDNNFKALSNYLSKYRMERILNFQVMHHGAHGDWKEGLASRLKPEFSVFSTNANRTLDPNTKFEKFEYLSGNKNHRHPNLEVWKDFSKVSKNVIVNEHSGLTIFIALLSNRIFHIYVGKNFEKKENKFIYHPSYCRHFHCFPNW
ncbi:hypothetical protein [Fluviispira sanaruensis]|nr:hypothetical protein [Fluviispira sanaruensis]